MILVVSIIIKATLLIIA